jgi:putative sterol carrier protein
VIAEARRRIARAPAQLADSVAGLVRDTSPERLEQLMRSPARRAILDAVFWQMPRHFSRRSAAGMNTVIEWQITGRRGGGADSYQVAISDARCRVRRGQPKPAPQLTITLEGADFLRLATGALDPMQGYFGGKITLRGDIMLAARLQTLFRVPK